MSLIRIHEGQLRGQLPVPPNSTTNTTNTTNLIGAWSSKPDLMSSVIGQSPWCGLRGRNAAAGFSASKEGIAMYARLAAWPTEWRWGRQSQAYAAGER